MAGRCARARTYAVAVTALLGVLAVRARAAAPVETFHRFEAIETLEDTNTFTGQG